MVNINQSFYALKNHYNGVSSNQKGKNKKEIEYPIKNPFKKKSGEENLGGIPNWIKWLFYILLAILLLILFFYLINKISNNKIFEDIKEKVEEKVEEKLIDKEYRGIIDEEQKNQLSGVSNIIINPIITGYYELITNDEKYLSGTIIVSDYPIPGPIQGISSCDINDKYRNFGSNSGLDYNGFIYEYLNSKKTDDIVVAILDSGINGKNQKLISHLYINSGEKNDSLDNDNNGYIDDTKGVNIEAGNGDTFDNVGHGTHIAGIVLQTFPNAKLLPIKVNGNNEDAFNELSVIKGIKYAIEQGADVINMSFGSRGMNIVEEELIKDAVGKGIIVIAAAGNGNENVEMYYPASYDGTLSVASFNKTGKSDFSNYGADIQMPGECIYSYGTNEPYLFMNGTSMSSPHLAGVIGGYMSLGNSLTGEDGIIGLINNNSVKIGGISVLKMPKLLGIENENNNFYEYLHEIHEILSSINEKLIALDDNLTSESIKSTLSFIENNKGKLSTSAGKIEKLYNDLGITEGFGVTIKDSLNEYLNFLSNSLDANSVQLTVTDKYLINSLGIETCDNGYCTTEDKINGCDDSNMGLACGKFDPIIKKGEQLPSSGTKSYTTIADYQTAFRIQIYQGDGKYVKSNKKLGEVLLEGIPEKPKGEARTDIYFTIDKYGYLSVSAVDSSNTNNKISTKVVANTEEKMSETEETEKIKNNLKTALNESKNMVNEIEKFYVLDPDNYIK